MTVWRVESATRSWFALFWGQGGWFAVILAGITLVFTYLAVPPHLAARTVAEDGVPVWAIVESHRIEDSDMGRRYFLTHRFTVDGAEQRMDEEVSKRAFQDRPNFMGKVNVVTKNPKLIAAREEKLRAQGRKWQRLALVAGLAALVVGWWCGRRATLALLARRLGQEEDAYIYEKNVSYGSSSPARVHIKFRSHSGVEGRSQTRFLFRFPNVERGDVIKVFVRNGTAWWTYDTGSRPSVPRSLPRILRRRRWRNWRKI